MKGKPVVWGSTDVDPKIIDVAFLKQLRQLCHPDRHNNSQLSQRVWERLEQVRKALDKV